jgi:hypothetical protein
MNLDSQENKPLIESSPTGGKRLKVGIEGQSVTSTLSVTTMRQTQGGDLQFGLPIRGSENLTDPVDRFRISQPQSMIDTDFEYGTQPTKWETLNTTNLRPYSYYNIQTPITLAGSPAIAYLVANQRTVRVTHNNGTTYAIGTPIYIQDTVFEGANGLFTVIASTSSTFDYVAQYASPVTTNILNANVTSIYNGFIFTGAQIGGTPTMTFSGLRITVTTTIPHGLALGNEIVVRGATATTNPPNGSWTVTRVINKTQFEFGVLAAPTGTIAGTIQLFVRPQGNALHRAFDGGVKFSSNAQSPNEQLVRQTRKYFRYQSGKGIQFSTGSILKPSFNPDLITSTGTTTITVNTKEPHNLQYGASIVVAGCNEAAYNGTFVVTAITSPTQFTYVAASAPAAGNATGVYSVYVNSWVGSTVRLGMFDDQNGLFFEFDGQVLYTVRRASTFQISGRITVNFGQNSVTGVGSEYSTQLLPGDNVVIKGQSYRVTRIASDTEFEINPSYRGPSITAPAFAYVTKTIDTKIPQSLWNIDRMNGAGGTSNPSSFNLDLSKMQMFYIDYSWYGAGAIRFGFRGTNGIVTYCHKIANNNVNFEAYMRSGNLPARYETNTLPPITRLTATLANNATTATVLDTSFFPAAGFFKITSADGNTVEYINYTGKTSTTFTGLTRAKAGEASLNVTIGVGAVSGTVTSTANIQVGMRVVSSAFPDGTYIASVVNATTLIFSQAAFTANPTGVVVVPMGATTGQTFTYNVQNPIGIDFGGPTAAPIISHWGSSVIMDGRFDEDKQFLFTSGSVTGLSVPVGATYALLSIRLAPSVSNGIVGPFGAREIINRMQLALNSLGVYANGNFLVTLILNGQLNAADTWVNVGGSSLSQVVFHTAARTIAGGETIGGFYVNSTGSAFASSTLDLAKTRDMGNSILGGGTTTTNTQFYPDGPDMLTIMVRNVGAAAGSVFGRLSWTEAQA